MPKKEVPPNFEGWTLKARLCFSKPSLTSRGDLLRSVPFRTVWHQKLCFWSLKGGAKSLKLWLVNGQTITKNMPCHLPDLIYLIFCLPPSVGINVSYIRIIHYIVCVYCVVFVQLKSACRQRKVIEGEGLEDYSDCILVWERNKALLLRASLRAGNRNARSGSLSAKKWPSS